MQTTVSGLQVETSRYVQGDALEISLGRPNYPSAKDIQSSLTSNGGCPKKEVGDSFTKKQAILKTVIKILYRKTKEGFINSLTKWAYPPLKHFLFRSKVSADDSTRLCFVR